MDDTTILTRAQLDAALDIQRAKHIERMTRYANTSYLWALALAVSQILCILLVRYLDNEWPPAIVIVCMLVSPAVCYFNIKARRLTAEQQLAVESARPW
jgi:FtsH-binding integral membrane protein